jgi:hypothetical protein
MRPSGVNTKNEPEDGPSAGAGADRQLTPSCGSASGSSSSSTASRSWSSGLAGTAAHPGATTAVRLHANQ